MAMTPSDDYDLDDGKADPKSGLEEGDDTRRKEDGGDDVAAGWVTLATEKPTTVMTLSIAPVQVSTICTICTLVPYLLCRFV